MARKFPKLNNDGFPYLDTVAPFKRKTDFDYGRYDYTATAKLMRVTWPSDYRHVVEWESEKARNAWFDAQAGDVIELTQGTVRAQTDRITLDVPYDVALTYNYIYMRVPQLTQDRPIDHEASDGIRTICAFIDSCTYLSPSSTEFIITVDVWTTYLPYKSVNGCTLARGHAPMWALSASQYLDNPIDRCADLLAPDVSFGATNVVRGGDFVPLSTADPLYVVASTIPYAALDSIVTATTQTSTPPTYYDLDARNGYQVGVSGYEWASGHSYNGMTSPSAATRADGSVPTGLYYYGILGSSVSAGALDSLLTALPVFALSCKAVFVVPSDLVSLGTTHTIAGVTLREVASKGVQAAATFDITKELFGYPKRYADIAKLYTDPYAHLEVSDDLGNSVSIAVEDTVGHIDVVQMLSIAFPALEWRTAIANAGSTAGEVRYLWAQLDGSAKTKAITNADFADTFIDFGIPTYALYLSARTEKALTSWADAQQRRDSAVLAYQSTMRSANTGRENTLASDATAKTNADASADAAKANADDSADTAKTNADASADTAKGNNDRLTAAARTNANTQNDYRSEAESNARKYTTDTATVDINYMANTAVASIQNQQMAAMSGIVNTVASGAGSVAAHALAGDAAGALISGSTSLSGALNAGASYAVAAATDAAIVSNAMTAAASKAAIAAVLSYVNVGNANDENTAITDTNTDASDDNATDTQTTTKNNATRTQGTAKGNATRTQGVTKANAGRSQSTGDANATYGRDTTMTNAKGSLENAQQGFARELASAAILSPVEHGSYSGSSVHEIWENRGLHLRAITQSQGAIKQAGDTFLRYGYQLGAAWRISEWVPNGARYCYWQSTDLWQQLDAVANMQAERTLEAILAAGVTVWKNPSQIGRFEA